jgi:hypothetical protein
MTAFVARCLGRQDRERADAVRARRLGCVGGLGRGGARLWGGAQARMSARRPQRESNPRSRSEVPVALAI